MKLSSTIAAAAAFLLGSANAVDFDFFDFEVGTSYVVRDDGPDARLLQQAA